MIHPRYPDTILPNGVSMAERRFHGRHRAVDFRNNPPFAVSRTLSFVDCNTLPALAPAIWETGLNGGQYPLIICGVSITDLPAHSLRELDYWSCRSSPDLDTPVHEFGSVAANKVRLACGAEPRDSEDRRSGPDNSLDFREVWKGRPADGGHSMDLAADFKRSRLPGRSNRVRATWMTTLLEAATLGHALGQGGSKYVLVNAACFELNQTVMTQMAIGQVKEAELAVSAVLASGNDQTQDSCAGLVLSNMATFMAVAGRTADAEKFAEQAVRILEKAYSPNDVLLLSPFQILATVWFEHDDDIVPSEHCFRTALPNTEVYVSDS